MAPGEPGRIRFLNESVAGSAASGSAILFFDGVCGVCNGFVDYVALRDPEARFRFAPLQGKAAAERGLAMQDWREASFVLEEAGVRSEASDAVLRVLVLLEGAWSAPARLALHLPRSFRDALYRYFARRRYGWFGQREACRIPTAEERGRFLD